jgi:hypothetical protein
MPPAPDGHGYIVFSRDNLDGWIEGQTIDAVNSQNVTSFVYEDIICDHGYLRIGDWVKHLLWADRISVRRSTGYSAFELVYGRECLLSA